MVCKAIFVLHLFQQGLGRGEFLCVIVYQTSQLMVRSLRYKVMGRLLEDSSGVISVIIVSNGAVNIEKVGELMGAPTYRFDNDTGEKERILMEYLQ
jgi:hypothetical protein